MLIRLPRRIVARVCIPFRLGALFLLAALFPACTRSEPGPGGDGHDAGAGALSCTPATLDFGLVVAGRAQVRPLRCVARGGPVVVGAALLEGPSATHFSASVPAGGLAFAPLEPAELLLAFSARGEGDAGARLTLLDADGTALSTHELLGTAVAHALALSPDAGCEPGLDFGSVPLGASATRPLVLENRAQQAILLTSLDVTPAGAFEFTAPVALPHSLPPGASLGARIELRPLAAGDQVATLTIGSDDPGGPQHVCVRGYGGGARLTCNAASLDLGELLPGETASASFDCVNDGPADPASDRDRLELLSLTTTSAEYTAVVRDAAPSLRYEAGARFTVDVRYTPVDAGRDEASLVLTSDASFAPEHRTTLTGSARPLPPCQLALRPAALDFGLVAPGASRTLELGVVNLLDTACRLTELRLGEASDASFTLPEGAIAERWLPGFAEWRVPVAFAPQAEGAALQGELLFSTSDPTLPRARVELRGASDVDCLRFEPESVEFGSQLPDCSTADREVRIVNVCADALDVTGIELHPGPSAEFLLHGAPQLPLTLAPGLSSTFLVAYRPEEAGVDLGFVSVHTAQAPEPSLVRLFGRGANDASTSETFLQRATRRTDLLFVIDNSGSLSEEQAQLGAGLPALLRGLASGGPEVDFHLGVTTTGLAPAGDCPGGASGGEDGRLFPVDGSHPRILGPGTPDLDAAWAHLTTVGICASQEFGLEAARRALSSPVIDRADDPRHPEPADGNLGLLREDALLTVVFVSDEDDQSAGTTLEYAEFLRGAKGDWGADRVVASAIVGDRSIGCATAEAGTRYLEVVDRTAGVAASFCAADWGPALEAIGARSADDAGLQRRFCLVNAPADLDGDGVIEPDLEVAVARDGGAVPATDPSGVVRWRFDGAARCVEFAPAHTPEPGAEVVVRYRNVCL